MPLPKRKVKITAPPSARDALAQARAALADILAARDADAECLAATVELRDACNVAIKAWPASRKRNARVSLSERSPRGAAVGEVIGR